MISRRQWLGSTFSGLSLAGLARGREEEKLAKKGRIFAWLRFEYDLNTLGAYAIDPDEGTWIRIGAEQMNPLARLSPDGSTLAWLKDKAQGAYAGVFLCDIVAGESRLVTEKAGRISWSPDGKELIVSMGKREVGESKAEVGTWRIDRKTGRAFKMPIAESIQVVDWSSDGETLLALEDEGAKNTGNRPLIAINLKGEQRRELVNDDGVSFNQTFSPDGRQAVFMRYEQKEDRLSQMGAWSIALDGTKRERMFDHLEGNRDPFHLRSSADGKRFAAILWGWAGEKTTSKMYYPQPENVLYVIDRSGESIRKIELPPVRLIRLIDWR